MARITRPGFTWYGRKLYYIYIHAIEYPIDWLQCSSPCTAFSAPSQSPERASRLYRNKTKVYTIGSLELVSRKDFSARPCNTRYGMHSSLRFIAFDKSNSSESTFFIDFPFSREVYLFFLIKIIIVLIRYVHFTFRD